MENSGLKPYINRIKVVGLFNSITLEWKVTPGVNILSGINGSGKSTVLQAITSLLKNGYFIKNPFKPIEKIEIYFDDGLVLSSDTPSQPVTDRTIDIVSTVDSSFKILEAVQKLTDNKVRTELDWELYNVNDRYLKYELALGKQAIDILLEGKNQDKLSSVMKQKTEFFDILDDLFEESGKTVIRDRDELMFRYKNVELTPYQLSSGEKQMIVILTIALTQNMRPATLIMDEPEISLHFEWQRKVIANIMRLNPSLQLLVSTHSPAVIMDGWIDKVQDISDLVV